MLEEVGDKGKREHAPDLSFLAIELFDDLFFVFVSFLGL